MHTGGKQIQEQIGPRYATPNATPIIELHFRYFSFSGQHAPLGRGFSGAVIHVLDLTHSTIIVATKHTKS